MLLIVINDSGYGVIRNIQDDKFGRTPLPREPAHARFQAFAQSIGLPSARVGDVASFRSALAAWATGAVRRCSRST